MGTTDNLGGEPEDDNLKLAGASDWSSAGPGFPSCALHSRPLWQYEREQLQPVLELIHSNRSRLLRNWHRLYLLYFGDARSLSEREFMGIFDPALDRNHTALLRGDLNGYARQVIHLGRLLARRRVPLEETIGSLHLFERAFQTLVAGTAPDCKPPDNILDKLSHLSILLLVTPYFGSRAAAAAEQISALEREAAYVPASARNRFCGLVGASAAMHSLYQEIETAAAAGRDLLIVGERGTGRELVARAVHQCGPRARGPFVSINCAAVSPHLVEGELFGYTRKSKGDVDDELMGLLRAANGGILFAGQITQTSAAVQKKLAQALEERLLSSGAGPSHRIDIQFIASSDRDPITALHEGVLCEELYQRLQASFVRIAPLRERREDIPLLAEHFIAMFNARLKRDVAGIEGSAMDALVYHAWPGNVRQLSDAIGHGFAAGAGRLIGVEHLPEAIAQPYLRAKPSAARNGAPPLGSLAETERELIRRVLESTAGNKASAAKMLRISRKKLYARIAKYNLAGKPAD